MTTTTTTTTEEKKYIAALDIGTTSLRCFIYDSNVRICGVASEKVKCIDIVAIHCRRLKIFLRFIKIELLYPQPGYCEINPDDLWTAVLKTIREAIENAKLTAKDITCLGISSQRSTFTTWDRESGDTFHNLITWKDLRADALVRKWNSSVTLKVCIRLRTALMEFKFNFVCNRFLR